MKMWVNGSIEWINDWMLVCEEPGCPWSLEIDKDDTEINLATLTEPAFRHYWEKHPEVQPPFSRTALDFAVSDNAPNLDGEGR